VANPDKTPHSCTTTKYFLDEIEKYIFLRIYFIFKENTFFKVRLNKTKFIENKSLSQIEN